MSALPNVAPCRDCAAEVSRDAVTCPHCGAPRPARREWSGEGYEWKSQKCIGEWPLIHIAFGIGLDGKVRTARGVVAVGQRAIGGIAIGILASGGITLGVVSVGLLSFGVVAVGALAAAGVNAVGLFAFGVTALGWMAGGVKAVAWKVLFSVAR
jgi:hypothetical protein